jgi:FkbM family methyltransferase
MMEEKSYCEDHIDLHIKSIFENSLKCQNSFFVDVGANDGITGSNTLLLEKNGWKGLLVEPNLKLKEQLLKIRTSPLETCAISNDEEVSFNTVSGPDNLHGLSRIDSSEKFVDHVKKHGGSVETTSVPATTLNKLFEKHSVPTDLPFLSIDVEGHELTVLNTLDFSKYNPRLIIVEDNSKGKDRIVHDFLNNHNYRLVKRVGVNEFYVNSRDVTKFLPSLIRVKIKYTRWKIKRSLFTLLGKEDKNQLV